MTIGDLIGFLKTYDPGHTVVLGVRSRHDERFFLMSAPPKPGQMPWPVRTPRTDVGILSTVVLGGDWQGEVNVETAHD